MEQRLGNTWRMTINEKKFIESALLSDLRVDGRRPFDYRCLTIKFGRHVLESRAVDTESLCVLAGKLVWSIRVDLHILDNGGNLVDAANIAALAALLTFRRPECTLGGEDGQEVLVHPPEAREPLSLIIHHLPIAVTFAFFGNENVVVIDPSYSEEAVMGGRMTATLNANGDVCAIQKGGGDGVIQSVIMQCLRIASVKAADITSKIKDAVEAYNTERTLRKIKRHSTSVAVDVDGPDSKRKEHQDQLINQNQAGDSSKHPKGRLFNKEVGNYILANSGTEVKTRSAQKCSEGRGDGDQRFSGGLSSWDPYTKGIDPESFSNSLALPGNNFS
ncbi:hypothetical protein GIB67_023860 [Kingdonia uniflora]|uniref:Uncharacterized protein n=1 Tax=Kingdonia uniflora TaxID=39325 RepID=A0A7J7NGL2_9MAGN|nr:hypothetical protein GIB67_023860 [Kingdonia uniflora]